MKKQFATPLTNDTADPAVVRRRRRFFNGTMIVVSLLCVAGIVTGATVGIWFKRTFLTDYDKTDYSNLSEAELRDDAEQIAKDYATRTPTKDKDALIKAFIAAEYNGLHADNFYSFANSFVDMGITTQSSYSDKTFDGTTVITNTASSGMISFAERVTYRVGEDNLTLIRDKNVYKQSGDAIDCPLDCRFKKNTIITSNYDKATTKEQSHADYVAATGSSPLGLITHIVSSKTVINNPADTFRTISLGGDVVGWAFTLRLNPKTSVLNTAKQMKYLSDLNDYPTFKSVRLDVVLIKGNNGKIYLKTIDSTEEYVVPYGILAPQGTGYTHTEFTFNYLPTDKN